MRFVPVSIFDACCEESLYYTDFNIRYTYKSHSEGDTGQRLRHPAHINTLCACFFSVYVIKNPLEISSVPINIYNLQSKRNWEIMASKADMTPEEREAKEQEEFSTGPLR